ncbi:hypothetical protein OG884_30635 [Streptosporangium sp. NBC_01755]|uniref:hypothetical protein n=1 Tax=unclassified Streptosporangium TaxID=2632669 RepID=UPI002DD9DFE4|nr:MULTISPECIES: hypothetical protein [unclassified Streptosporangium]WSA29393.1 hypothetical protein OIE13_16840 [Streptosporangium sp. NBC_01810]WSC99163.1 hypothetical protein OG884_30635 [Streptosporangium sp. NBC_01755]
MSTVIWVAVVVVAVVAIVAVGYLVLQQQRRHRLRDRFGPEYERTLQERDSRRDAEQELRAREQRFSSLDIRTLDAQTREIYAKKWMEVQERFVDAPGFAVTEADHLVTSVMAERGYPTEDFEQRLSDLSVAHGRTLDHYRQAHEISTRAAHKEASTEELRQAMVHYRALFEELLAAPGSKVNGERNPRHAAPSDRRQADLADRDLHHRDPRQTGAAAPETTDGNERAHRRDPQGR